MSPSSVQPAVCAPRPTPAAIADLDTINICVPTPLRKTKDPDLSYVVSAVEMIAEHLRPGQLVILESTTYPGTTDEVVRRFSRQRGLRGRAGFLPRVLARARRPGQREVDDARTCRRSSAALTPACTALAKALYSASIDTVVEVSSPKVAEMVKLLENTFRAVNIGLVNELALMCDRLGISVWEVVDAAATKPFGFMPFYPGPGLGGHCIPIDPFYLSWKVKEVGFEARFIELAGHVNGAMPHHVVDKVADALNIALARPSADRRCSCSASSYKRDIDDFRESPALDVMAALRSEGRAAVVTTIRTCRPIDGARLAGRLRPGVGAALTPTALAAADCVVILTDHRVFDYDQHPEARAAHRRLAERDQERRRARLQAWRAERGKNLIKFEVRSQKLEVAGRLPRQFLLDFWLLTSELVARRLRNTSASVQIWSIEAVSWCPSSTSRSVTCAPLPSPARDHVGATDSSWRP